MCEKNIKYLLKNLIEIYKKGILVLQILKNISFKQMKLILKKIYKNIFFL